MNSFVTMAFREALISPENVILTFSKRWEPHQIGKQTVGGYTVHQNKHDRSNKSHLSQRRFAINTERSGYLGFTCSDFPRNFPSFQKLVEDSSSCY